MGSIFSLSSLFSGAPGGLSVEADTIAILFSSVTDSVFAPSFFIIYSFASIYLILVISWVKRRLVVSRTK